MKTLFLIFHGFSQASGISKKIHYQVKGFQACGNEVHLCHYNITPHGNRRWMVNDEVIADFGTGIAAKVWKRIRFSPIVRYVRREKIELVYIRSYHNANPFTIRLVRQLRREGARVVMEIPTYPYDQEYITRSMQLDLAIDRMFRHRLAHELNAIVTFSSENIIFGQRTIRISNGIDFDAIPLKQHRRDTSSDLHLIGVAEVHYWHGFDRIIQGLADYYRSNPSYQVYFHIVGALTGEREQKEILQPLAANGLEPYVILHGTQYGEALDTLFEQADFAIGSLARHRSGITHIKTLKNREYAARGFAFAYSETDSDFDNRPYVLKIPANESPVDISRLIAFHHSVTLTPQEIRHSVDSLSWTEQMRLVTETVSNLPAEKREGN